MPTQRLNLFYGGSQPAFNAESASGVSQTALGILGHGETKAKRLAFEENLAYERNLNEQERARKIALEDEDRLGLPMVKASEESDIDPSAAPARFRPLVQANIEKRHRGEWDTTAKEAERVLSAPAGGLDLVGGSEDIPEGLVGKGGALNLYGKQPARSPVLRDREHDAQVRAEYDLRVKRAGDLGVKAQEEEIAKIHAERAAAEADAARASASTGVAAPAVPTRTYTEGQRNQARVLWEKLDRVPPAERERRGWTDDRMEDLYAIGYPQKTPSAKPSAPTTPAAPTPATSAPTREPVRPAPPSGRDRSLLDLPGLGSAPSPIAWPKETPTHAWGRAPRNVPNVKPSSEMIENLDPQATSNGGMNMAGKFVSDTRAQALGIAKAFSAIPHDRKTATSIELLVSKIDRSAKAAGAAFTSNDRAAYEAIQRDMAADLQDLRDIYESRQAAAGPTLNLP